jgi:hypothetical protein
MRSNPNGLTKEQEDLIWSTNWFPQSTILMAKWFSDGLTPVEIEIARNAAAGGAHVNTFVPVFDRLQQSPWYHDGLDEAERELMTIAIMSSGNSSVNELFDAVDAGGYSIERMTLPESGERGLLIVGARAHPANLAATSVEQIKRLAPQVEGVAGPYRPKYFVIQVGALAPGLCGSASTRGGAIDTPGVIRFSPNCVRDVVTAHELAHAYVGTGPTWWTEGVADTIAMRITGVDSFYFASRATGLIDLESWLESGTSASIAQGSLGAQFLINVNQLIGPQALNAAIRQITPNRFQRTGRGVLDAILAQTPASLKPQLQALIDASFAKPR